MGENVDNLVLEQPRLIRETLGDMRSEMAGMERSLKGEVADLRSEILGQRAILVGLGTYIGSLDVRVEHLEKLMGVDA